jgi:hypothetical protein
VSQADTHLAEFSDQIEEVARQQQTAEWPGPT